MDDESNIPKYSKREVNEILQKQAEKLGESNEIIFMIKPRTLKLIVLRFIMSDDGLTIEVR